MRAVLATSILFMAACSFSSEPVGKTAVFPDMEKPGTFNRMYTFTENADATIRVWTQEQGDQTNLYEMRKSSDGTWGEVRQITEFPNQGMLTEPSFSASDGYLYFASNAVLPLRGRGQDPNIWRVQATGRGWAIPEPLSDAINTGAAELSPVMDDQGRLYFTSNHKRGDGGHDIYEAHFDDEQSEWVVKTMPEGFNSPRADAQIAVTPDGQRMFFYTYRQTKLGFVDIWTATRGEDGEWQLPVNLGPAVNGEGPELGPSVSLDGKTFYFSQDGQLMKLPMREALATAGWQGEDPATN